MFRNVAAWIGMTCACGCSADPPDTVEDRSEGPFTEPAVLTDTNPDPKIVEVQLVAGTGATTYIASQAAAEIWGYRDGAKVGAPVTVPGPLLRANEGDEVIIHFRNELPEETTIHWHGIRLPNQSDGTLSSQRAVKTGETYEYRFVARDPGSYWYHPHVKADEQIERGLYAPIVVTGGIAPEVAADRYFVLDEVQLAFDGTLTPKSKITLDFMLGKQGNVRLVNGQPTPRALTVAAGTRERWRFVNSANGRFFNLRLPGHKFLVIGTDGGLMPSPYQAETVLVAPGERYEVLVTFSGAPGSSAQLETIHYDRGHNLADPGPMALLSLKYAAAAPATLPALPTKWRELARLPVTPDTFVRRFELDEADGENGALPRFFINQQQWPNNTPITVQRDAIEIWEVENKAEMDHPFHLHGMFFEVLTIGAMPPLFDGLKDTLVIPKQSTARFAVKYDAAPGMWMFHCHILEHAELGMMGDLMIME